MATMTTSTVSAAAMTFYKKRAQSFLRKRLYLNKLGTQETIPKFSGQVLSTFRVNNLSAATSSLTEGTAPSDNAISTTTYSATLLQYGNFCKISDLLEITGRSSMMDVASKQMGYNGALSVDALMQTELVGNATAQYANNTNSGTIGQGDVLTATELRRTAKKLLAKDVNPGEDDLFNIVIHPDQQYDLMTDDKVGSWLDLNRRLGDAGENVWVGEAGRLAMFRILISSQIDSVTTNGITTFRAIACGPDAVLNVDVDSMPFNLFVSPSTNINPANPLAQLGTVGWKATYVAKYIGGDGPRAYVIYSAVSEQS